MTVQELKKLINRIPSSKNYYRVTIFLDSEEELNRVVSHDETQAIFLSNKDFMTRLHHGEKDV